MNSFGRIGFVNLCHEDYIDNNVTGMAGRAAKALRDKGFEIVEPSVLASSWENARLAGEELVSERVDGVILFLGAWMECATAMAALREIEHLPLCLWGFPMFMQEGRMESTGSYVSYAMFQGTLKRAGYRFTGILGLPEDEAAVNRAADFALAASAAVRLRRSRVGLVGYTSMSIYPGTFDHLLMRTRIGPEIVHSDSYSLIRLAEQAGEEETRAASRRITELGRVSDQVTESSLNKAAGLFAALRETCKAQHLDAINVKCQYEFSKEYRMVPCVPLSALAEDGVTAGCEGDILCTVSQLMLHLLTGQTVTYGDAINHEGNVVKFSSCGMLPFSMGEGERLIQNFMPHPGFTGIQASFVMRPETITFLRLVEDVGGYHLLYGAGRGQKTQLRQGYMPAIDVAVDDIGRLTESYSGQHFALCYGDWRPQLEALAHILNIGLVRI